LPFNDFKFHFPISFKKDLYFRFRILTSIVAIYRGRRRHRSF